MSIQSYRDLLVWQEAMKLTAETYKITEKLPKSETYALSDQMRRSAVSIPSNIAEGFGRKSTAEFIHFLSISHGSLCELETQFELCSLINYTTEDEIRALLSKCSEIGKMLQKLMKSLKTTTNH